MKKLTLISVMFMAILSCKKEEICTFNSAYFGGKTFKVTKFVVAGIDQTKTTDICLLKIISFKTNGIYQETKQSTCITTDTGTWTTHVSSGKNYLTLIDKFEEKDTVEIQNLDCNNYVMSTKIFGQDLKATFTKQ